jgi:hypothetical protein
MYIKDDYKNEMLDLIKQNSEIQESEAVEETENEIVETENIEETENLEGDNQEKEVDIDKQLSGLPKELVEAVKTFKDPEDREKAIRIAKEQRAREDRLHLQLGNTKKELENVSGLLKNLESNPAETFKALAKRVNFDLKQVVDEAVYEDELYLTPEEQIKREAKNIQQNSYQLLQNEVNKRESKELLAEFLEDTSHSEDLIVEHQQEFINFYNQELVKNGVQDYYPLKTRRKALETAYKKIEILQPDYENKIREKILKELNEQKKEKFEDAKKQQRISKPVANANKPMTYEEEQKALIRKYL